MSSRVPAAVSRAADRRWSPAGTGLRVAPFAASHDDAPAAGHDFARVHVHAPASMLLRQVPETSTTGTSTAAPPTTPTATTTTATTAPASEPAPARKKVCLTFDDGPEPGTTDVLSALGSVKATFFLTGRNMKGDQAQQASIIAAMLAAGHAIGNHTFTHFPQRPEDYEAVKTQPEAKQAEAIQGNMKTNAEYFSKLFEDNKAAFVEKGIAALPPLALARLPGSGKTFPQFVKLVEDLGMAHVPWQTEFLPNAAPKFGHVRHRNWQGVEGVRGEHAGCPSDGWILLFHDRHWLGRAALLTNLVTKLNTGCGCDFGTLDASGKCV